MSELESAADRGDLAPAPAARAAKRSAGLWLAVGFLAIAVAWGASSYFKHEAAKPTFEPPPPRPVANAPYIPTAEAIVDRMLELAEVGPDDVVYDLGCGDGRILVTAAKRYGCRCFGFDIDPERVAEARENAKQNGVEQLVSIEQRDILTLDLSEATVVTMYLLPKLNAKLIPQLDKLRPGARVVSHAFEIEGIEPEKRELVLKENGDVETVLYRFTSPLKHRESTNPKH
jgi:SAM-dependent methyltransferase